MQTIFASGHRPGFVNPIRPVEETRAPHHTHVRLFLGRSGLRTQPIHDVEQERSVRRVVSVGSIVHWIGFDRGTKPILTAGRLTVRHAEIRKDVSSGERTGLFRSLELAHAGDR